MSEDQTMSAEEFQNQYFADESQGLEDEMTYDLESGLLGEDDEFANLRAELAEAREQLVSMRSRSCATMTWSSLKERRMNLPKRRRLCCTRCP